jgi:hypothetical protein
MSGPKCVDVRESRRTLERRQNQSRCNQALLEYQRLLAKLSDLRGQLTALGADHREAPLGHQEAARRVAELVGADRDVEAVPWCEGLLRDVKATLEQGQARLKQRIGELQERFRRFRAERIRLEAVRERLPRTAVSTLPADWPESEKSRIKRLLHECLLDVAVPGAVETTLTPAGIEALTAAEQQLARARLDTDAAQKRFNQELTETHARLLGQKLARIPKPQALPAEDATSKAEPAEQDGSLAQLDEAIKQLAALQLSGNLGDLQQKAGAVRAEKDEDRRQLLLRGFLVECSERMKAVRALSGWREDLEALADKVSLIKSQSASARAILSELEALRRVNQVVKLDGLKERARQVWVAEEKRLANENRRQAIFESLAELGYRVSEELQTAEVRQSSLVLHKSQDQDYGLEIAFNEDLGLVQTQLVRYSSSPESTSQQKLRDREREEAWCSDHDRLLASMTRQGFQVSFKSKVPPGAAPMKLIQSAGADEARRQGATAANLRRRTA